MGTYAAVLVAGLLLFMATAPGAEATAAKITAEASAAKVTAATGGCYRHGHWYNHCPGGNSGGYGHNWNWDRWYGNRHHGRKMLTMTNTKGYTGSAAQVTDAA
eukprot:jgi/Chrzof1/5356/UNPLg00821.t1